MKAGLMENKYTILLQEVAKLGLTMKSLNTSGIIRVGTDTHPQQVLEHEMVTFSKNHPHMQETLKHLQL